MARGYPAFVLSPRADPLASRVPVFVYHGVEPRAFERDLEFLADNGYRTVEIESHSLFHQGGVRRHGDRGLHHARLDFLWRLPAANRASLTAIYGRKAVRRLRGERVH